MRWLYTQPRGNGGKIRCRRLCAGVACCWSQASVHPLEERHHADNSTPRHPCSGPGRDIDVGVRRRCTHHKNPDHHEVIAHLRGLFVAGRRAIRKDCRQSVRRGRSGRPEELGHRRHPPRPAECERPRRVLIRLLHPETDRSYEGHTQSRVRAAEPRLQDLVDFGTSLVRW